MWTRIDWSVSHFSVTNIKLSYYVEKWKKRCFYNLRQLSNLLWQWCATWRKLNLSHTCFNSSEVQESCDSLAKINFVRATFQKFGAMCDHIRKNTEASRNCCIIYLKSKHSCEHCIYNESGLNNKTEKVWHLFIYPFILLLLLMFYVIVFICCSYVDPNEFPYLLVSHTLLRGCLWDKMFLNLLPRFDLLMEIHVYTYPINLGDTF